MRKKYKEVMLTQGSPEWLAWRNNGVTATNAVVLGQGLINAQRYPKESVYRLWAEKTGLMSPQDLSGNPNIQRGKRLEDVAREAAEKELNELLVPICIESCFDPMVRASLDGITSTGEPVEIKCPHPNTWMKIKKEGENSPVFKRYWIQVQHQLLSLGANKGHLIFYMENEPIMRFEIPVDKAFLSQLYRLEKEFWEGVKTNIPPQKDPEEDHFIPKGETAKEWIFHSEQFKALESEIEHLKGKISELEKAQKSHKDFLVNLLEDYKTAEFNGLQITRVERQGSLDPKKLAEKLASLDSSFNEDDYKKKASSYIRITRTKSDLPKDVLDEEVIQIIEDKKQDYKSAMF